MYFRSISTRSASGHLAKLPRRITTPGQMPAKRKNNMLMAVLPTMCWRASSVLKNALLPNIGTRPITFAQPSSGKICLKIETFAERRLPECRISQSSAHGLAPVYIAGKLDSVKVIDVLVLQEALAFASRI